MNMSVTSWIKFLLLLATLISYCCGYKQPIDHLRRRTRDAQFKDIGQQMLNKVIADQGQIDEQIKQAVRKDEETVRMSTLNITLAAQKIAQTASQDVSNVEQWTIIQSQIRVAINVIIDAYRRFITLHRDTCDSVENFTKTMVEKYESELSALDRLSAPATRSGNIDNTSPDYSNFIAQLYKIMTYAKFHQNTLSTAVDAPLDMIMKELERRRTIMNGNAGTPYYQIDQPTNVPNSDLSFPSACGPTAGDNGCQSCAKTLATVTMTLLTRACPNQCA